MGLELLGEGRRKTCNRIVFGSRTPDVSCARQAAISDLSSRARVSCAPRRSRERAPPANERGPDAGLEASPRSLFWLRRRDLRRLRWPSSAGMAPAYAVGTRHRLYALSARPPLPPPNTQLERAHTTAVIARRLPGPDRKGYRRQRKSHTAASKHGSVITALPPALTDGLEPDSRARRNLDGRS